jgi:hypothetical protein
MRIAFHSNQLSLRGTEVSMYDFGKYNEEILNNESVIFAKDPSIWQYSHPLAEKKFKDRFKVFQYKNFNEVEKILDREKIDIFYTQKAGFNDGIVSPGRKTVVHSVFQHYEPHGDVYAYISKWLGDKYKSKYVPYIVDLPKTEDNLRKQLNIPSNAIVFGRHGGLETFDIPFVYKTIEKVLAKRDDIYFLFLFTNKFINHKNVIFLEGNQDLVYKVNFINTCDAMLHARKVGETFGLAVAEFSLRNKPVFTFGGNMRESAHIQMLGNNAIKYHNENELFNKILNFKPDSTRDWNSYKEYNPEKIMNVFKKVFIDG